MGTPNLLLHEVGGSGKKVLAEAPPT